ncbi:mucin-12-like [Cynara cardunculus var. scolymus]|uniref:Uncharacterized protein n=1 Tax=Cynara cardunculus var. scolymus TaxID=59895 RepID=A0A124SI42_CYNCS|nr:mucin-12-like [Cynara cardunculus var. scolymus]KVI11493.1 hypothetical protein Ccrd_010095 [Cynara cardunculus var. scolymus]
MAAFVDYRQEEMSCGETKEKEIGDDLSLLIDFSGANLNLDLLQKSNQFQETLDSESENPFMPQTKSMIHGQDPGADDLLNSENSITDYDWLLSPPRNPLLSLELEEHKTLISDNLMSSGQSTSPKSSLGTPSADNISTTTMAPTLPASSNGIKSSSGTIRRPSPSRKAPSTGSRSSTPTTRATVPSTTKPSRSSTPTSRPIVASTKPVAPSKRSITPTKSSARSSTPTPRPSIPSAASKSISRSSTPTLRPSIIAASKSTSRSSTPTQQPSNPSGLLTTSVNGGRSSSVTKARAPSVKNPASSRGSSPSVKSRPSKNPPEMTGFATEAPPHIKKSLPERPASVSKGRPGLNTVKLPASECNSKAIPKRSSCSPSRGQVLNGSSNNGVKSGLTKNRGYSNGSDDVNPVLMGTKMVERVVNMRKLAPPRQDYISNQNNTSGKLSVSQDNSGFGRTLSKKSFDMALRHLDIRRSMPGNMRAMITKVPASSVYSVRSESTKTQTISASDSPLATSSSASSDNNPSFVDGNLANENGHLYPHDQ